jgi:hypothetical protein
MLLLRLTPSLPAALTTSVPEAVAWLTARFKAESSVPRPWLFFPPWATSKVAPRLMLITSAWTAGPEAYSMPWMTLRKEPLPDSRSTLTGTSSASGATPCTPKLLMAAATMPPTWVPWLKQGAVHCGCTTWPETKEIASPALMLGTRSGLVRSMPLSTTATRAP